MPVIPLSSVSANTLRVLGQVRLPVGPADTPIYTVPANAQTDVPPQRIIVANTAAGNEWITLHLRIGGIAASNSNIILNQYNIAGNLTAALDFGLTMAATDVLSGFAKTVDTLTITVCGFESTA